MLTRLLYKSRRDLWDGNCQGESLKTYIISQEFWYKMWMADLCDIHASEDGSSLWDSWQALCKKFGGQMIQVQVDVVLLRSHSTSFSNLYCHTSGYNIPGGKILGIWCIPAKYVFYQSLRQPYMPLNGHSKHTSFNGVTSKYLDGQKSVDTAAKLKLDVGCLCYVDLKAECECGMTAKQWQWHLFNVTDNWRLRPQLACRQLSETSSVQ